LPLHINKFPVVQRLFGGLHVDSNQQLDKQVQTLSDSRAVSVAEYRDAQGVNGQRMITVGMGELRPVADNETSSGRQANRRVEITLVPITA
jgi:outer membrane protein OmpA-like peptidoglycan-associated protein